MTNLDALRKLLWAVGTDGKPTLRTDKLLVLTAGQVAAYVQSGRILLLTRERVQSIVSQLEGKEAPAVDYDSFNYDLEDSDNLDLLEPEPKRGRGRPPTVGSQRMEMNRQKAIDHIREHGPGLQADVCRAIGVLPTSAYNLFCDRRFITGGRGVKVRLDEQAIELATKSIKQGGSFDSLKNCIEMIYTELTLASPLTFEQIRAVLQYDRALIDRALKSPKFEPIEGRWRIRKK